MSPKLKLKVVFVAMKIVLCLSLMITTSYALFTAQSGNIVARVNAAEVDVGLYQADATGTYQDIEGENGHVFGDQLWEPNHTQVAFFKIENGSNINTIYALSLNVDIKNLAGAFEVCAFESEYFDVSGLSWEEISDMAAEATNTGAGINPTPLGKGINRMSGADYVALAPKQDAYWVVAVRMLPTAGNEFKDGECTIDVTVDIFQGNADPDKISSGN